MSCQGVDCAAFATCHVAEASYTCRCNSGYDGDGFNGCVAHEGLEQEYVWIIILVVIIAVGLISIVVYFLCRRRIIRMTKMRKDWKPFVTTEVDPYDLKWRMMRSGDGSPGLGKAVDIKDIPHQYQGPYQEASEPKHSVTDDAPRFHVEADEVQGSVGFEEKPDDLSFTINYIEEKEMNF